MKCMEEDYLYEEYIVCERGMVHGLAKRKLIILDRDISCIIGNHCSMEKLNTVWKILIAVIHVQNEIILYLQKISSLELRKMFLHSTIVPVV